MRALYQRKKGRDIYDLWLSLRSRDVSREQIVECFQRYMEHDGAKASRAQFDANLAGKLKDKAFLEDVQPLIPAGVDYDPLHAAALVQQELISKLPGDPWKGTVPE